jgi:hypothetical protein
MSVIVWFNSESRLRIIYGNKDGDSDHELVILDLKRAANAFHNDDF